MSENKPNKRVTLVFEEMETQEENLVGCRVYLTTEGRDITPEIFDGDDWTIPERWAAQVFDMVREQLATKAADETISELPKKENMN